MSLRSYERSVQAGTMKSGGVGRPHLWRCEACDADIWEDEAVQRGAYNTVFCETCDPLKGMEHCAGCGYDAASCECDRRTA